MKRSNDWKAFYGVAPLREGYLRLDSEIHLHIVIASDGVDMADFCIVFQRHPCLQPSAEIQIDDRNPAAAYCCHCGLSECKTHTTYVGSDDLQLAMFVGVVNLLQKPKGTVTEQIPSVVWLQPLEACAKSPFEVIESVRVGPKLSTATTRAIQGDGEASSTTLTINASTNASRWMRSKLTHKNLQRRPEVVYDLADNDRPVGREFVWVNVGDYAKNLLTRVRVDFSTDNSIGIAVDDLSEFSIECIDLFDCSANFRPTAFKGMHAYTVLMEKKVDKQKAPQGYEIPVPKRENFMENLKNVPKPSIPRRQEK